jgi:hypothetical protein
VHWLLGNLSPIAPASLAVFAALTALGGWLVIGAARRPSANHWSSRSSRSR